jgi:N-acetylmuramoyl-L-alanine amidase
MHWISRAGMSALFISGLVSANAQDPPQAVQIPQQQPANPPHLPTAASTPVVPRFMVVLDAAHGGTETGARINDHLLEKDLTLNLSIRLRSMLSAHGIGVVTTRESDANVPATERAETADRSTAAACILIHATATGSGVHIYTSSLPPSTPARFMPWQTAQSGYITQSLKLASEIDSALAHAEVPVTLGRTALQPMDSFTCPAVAVEIAPLAATSSTKGKALDDAAYQRTLLDALTAALDEWRNDWRQQP